MTDAPLHGPFVRLAREDDLDGILALARLTGGGMTNLPADAGALADKIAWSLASMAKPLTAPEDEYYLLVLEDPARGQLLGTCSIYSRLGARWPFYSFKVSRVTHVSRDLGRHFSTDLLHVVNDFDGASEVGGLFLHPDGRASGLGALLARSRYMFVAQHRRRFSDRMVGDLRGWVDNGTSPFWQAVGEPFFGSNYYAADLHNALHGNQFIADLMPRYPIYASMLPENARAAIGRPHPGSEPARAMLEAEGFRYQGYVDIFDAGPTLSVQTDYIRTLRESRVVDGLRAIPGERLMAQGTGVAFRAWLALLP